MISFGVGWTLDREGVCSGLDLNMKPKTPLFLSLVAELTPAAVLNVMVLEVLVSPGELSVQ